MRKRRRTKSNTLSSQCELGDISRFYGQSGTKKPLDSLRLPGRLNHGQRKNGGEPENRDLEDVVKWAVRASSTRDRHAIRRFPSISHNDDRPEHRNPMDQARKAQLQ